MLPILAALSASAQDRGARPDDAVTSTTPAPRDRLWYTNATFVRVNPLGLVDAHKVGWRRRLSTKPGVLFSDTYAFTGLSALVTPAYSRLGVYGEVQPLAVLRVFGEITGTGYYGTFDQVLAFDADARWSDRSIDARGDEARGAVGWTATFGVTLQAKVGPIAARTTPQVTRIDLALGPDDGTFFYDQFWDRLAPDGGWMVLNDLDVLFVREKLRAGVRHTFSDSLQRDQRGTDGGIAQHRVGPLFAWQFFDRAPGARFNQPTLFVLAQWWLQHPYRAGDEQSQGLPLIAVGFAFNGDYAVSR
ncbi:MAG: hypothetical protein H6737_04090 [Alphaproteobacteria bacterium]|nr:hypothetical protein [Alphaproteobacteria bacterium]